MYLHVGNHPRALFVKDCLPTVAYPGGQERDCSVLSHIFQRGVLGLV